MNFVEKLLIGETNCSISVTDADGNPKTLWQENRLGRTLRHAGHDVRIPGLTGWHSDTIKNHNLVPDGAHAGLAGVFASSGFESPGLVTVIGTGTTPPANTDTALQAQATDANVTSHVSSISTTTLPSDTCTWTTTFSIVTAASISEEGLMCAGFLLARQTFTPIACNVSDIVTCSHSVTC